MSTTKTIATLAVAFAAGSITEEYIRSEYGDSIFTTVAGLASGMATGGIAAVGTNAVLNTVERHTGLVSMADEVIDAINPLSWFD